MSKPLYAAVEFGKRANGDIYRRDIRVASGDPRSDDTEYQERRSAINLVKIWMKKWHLGRCADCGSGRIEV